MKERKLTRNDLQGDIIIRFGYCAIQSLLQGRSRAGYNCGVYGWNWDAYNIYVPSLNKFVTITTGYRNLVGLRPDYDIVSEYERKAESLYNQYEWTDYETITAEREKLLIEMLEKIIKTEG